MWLRPCITYKIMARRITVVKTSVSLKHPSRFRCLRHPVLGRAEVYLPFNTLVLHVLLTTATFRLENQRKAGKC